MKKWKAKVAALLTLFITVSAINLGYGEKKDSNKDDKNKSETSEIVKIKDVIIYEDSTFY